MKKRRSMNLFDRPIKQNVPYDDDIGDKKNSLPILWRYFADDVV
jgi:hypothetical protein